MFHSITPLGDCFVSGVSSVFEEYVVCHASAHSVNVHGLKTCSLFAETVLHSSSAFAMAGPFTAGLPGGISSSTMENLPWLASQFPDLPQPSPNMSDASLTQLLCAVKGRRFQWEVEMRRLRMVELFLDRSLFKATNGALAQACAVSPDSDLMAFDVDPEVQSAPSTPVALCSIPGTPHRTRSRSRQPPVHQSCAPRDAHSSGAAPPACGGAASSKPAGDARSKHRLRLEGQCSCHSTRALTPRSLSFVLHFPTCFLVRVMSLVVLYVRNPLFRTDVAVGDTSRVPGH